MPLNPPIDHGEANHRNCAAEQGFLDKMLTEPASFANRIKRVGQVIVQVQAFSSALEGISAASKRSRPRICQRATQNGNVLAAVLPELSTIDRVMRRSPAGRLAFSGERQSEP